MSSILPSIEEFNQLQIESQQSIISSQLNSKLSEDKKANLTKVLNLLAYLNENNDQQGKHLFSIASQNKENNLAEVIYQINEIELSYQATEVLEAKNRLKSNEFENHLSNFGTVILELKYISKSFNDSYRQLLSLKTKISTRTRIIISIFISGISQTDMNFRNDKNVEIIKLDSTVTQITGGKIEFRNPNSGGSFSRCSSLTLVSIPSSVTSIEEASFNGCLSLTQITIPSSVTSIGSAAFRGCSLITQITIPSSVTLIRDFSFNGCSSLKQISFMIPSIVTSIGNYAFNECSSLTEISIPSSVKTIGNLAFRGCSSLMQISFMIPSSVTSIGDYAFYECISLKQISIPSSLKTIGIDAFSKCSDELENISNVLFQNQLKELISQIEKAGIDDRKSDFLKNCVVHEIIQICQKSPKEDNHKRYIKIVHLIIDILANDKNILKEVVDISDYNETPNIKLYNSLIWFSHMKALIDKISDPGNQNVLIDIIELNKFPEMQSTVHFLIKKLIEFSPEGNFAINEDDKSVINSTLRAQFIMKCENLDDLYKIFNDIMIQNQLPYQEINTKWIYHIVNQYNLNLSILLPQFEPHDLFYLFVGYSGDKNNLEQGPLISSINCKNILESFEKIIFTKPNTFVECADNIVEIIYRIVCNKDKVQCNHSEYKDLFKQELKKSETDANDSEKNVLIKSAIFVLDISDKISSLTNDFTFSTIKSNVLPLWMFTLRLISQNRDMHDFYSSSDIGKIITTTIQKCIKNYMQSNESNDLGADIFSLLFPNVPSEIMDPNYHMFYDFFTNLSDDNKKVSFSEKKCQLIEEFIEDVCQIIFKKKVKEFLEKPFENLTDKDLAFIYDPNMFINQQIKALIRQQYLDFIESQSFRTIKSNSIQIEENLNLKVSQIEESIVAEKKSIEKRYIEKNTDFYNVNIPDLIFGNSRSSDEFVNELKSTINIFSSFIKNIEDDIQNDKIKKEDFIILNKIHDKFLKIPFLLTTRFSDGTECPIVTDQLNELKEIYSLLIHYTEDIKNEMNKIYQCYSSFPNLKDNQNFFTNQYHLPLPPQKKVMNLENNKLFDSFVDSDFLYLPVLYVEKDENNQDIITCCFNSVECSIGPIIPSLYRDKCIMNFESYINSPFSIEVKTDDEHKDLFQTKELINRGEPCQIFIQLPLNTSNDIENISIDTTLIIKSANSSLKPKELPCKFNFKLIPLKILISCAQYPLSFINDAFYLSPPIIHSNTKLEFRFINIFAYETLNIVYQLIEFDDNQAEKPDISYNSQNKLLILNIPNVENVSRLHYTLKIKFSVDLETNIEIDSIIVPFEFGFDLYDYTEKKYVDTNSTLYYSLKYPDREIVLHFRLYGIFSSQMNVKIQNNFDNPVKVVSTINNLVIHEDTEFDIKIRVLNQIPHNLNRYYVSVKIGDIEKKIGLNFIEKDLNESQIQELYERYNEIDVLAKDSHNESKNTINKIKKEINSIVLHQQQQEEAKNESYLISACSKPEPCSIDQFNDICKKNDLDFTDKIINIDLPEIVIPSESEWKALSIQSLNKLYQTYAKGAMLFPIYVKNMEKQKSPEMIKFAQDYFLKLLQIYEPLTCRDHSFISTSVNLFSYSFTNMVSMLENARVNFHGLVHKKHIMNVPSLIELPEKSQLTL